ncbi:MAG: nucleoside phosphorylase [Candidatus Thorarchaeota archaeon]
MGSDKEYHIDIAPGEIPELVLLPGDPDRARLIAEQFFDNPVEVSKKREYWSFKGIYKGVPVGVCSTGIGCPSAAIAIEELVKVGCKVFVRVGTAGAIHPDLITGDVIIFTGAVRDDGTSRQYVPLEFPAVADPKLVVALTHAAEMRGAKHYVGIGHSKDAFYSEYPDLVTNSKTMREHWESMKRANVLATEMESAALFVIGHLRGVKVGAICVIVGENIEKEAKIVGKPPLDDLVTIALDAMIALK